ncbi:hypothetical protein GCM10010405_46200 [Streptomyces macrosporus]|uniref:Uncharacterized protein n=1 Tax=Streptomyces macrosporus TaxID=44032 RepID=A0ABN3KH51_9ACTN
MYQIDVRSGILRQRSWIWLRTRIYGLLSADSRIARRLNPPKQNHR